jgi:hypothetical protein
VLKGRHFPAGRAVKFELPVSLEFEGEPAAPPPPAPPAAPPPPVAPPPPEPIPAGLTKKYRAVPLQVLDSSAVDEPLPAVKAIDGKSGIGTYMVFVEINGTVSRADVVVSIPGLDQAIMAKLRTWRFKKQRERVRSVVRFSVSPAGIERI